MAAVLIIVITLVIVLYILFLPKTDRDQLLADESGATSGSTTTTTLPGSVLLDEHPGVLTNIKESTFDHSIPSFNLFTTKEDTTLKSVDSIYVESTKGADKKDVLLSVNDKAENARLAFSVNAHSGNLIITQNGNEIFHGEVQSFIEPLSITLEKDNLFEFSVEPVPWYKPFSKNFYDIRNFQVMATVEKLDNKEALQTVLISQDEANLVSEASLSYFVDCDIKEVGRLTIYLNDKFIASKVPDCGSAEKLQLDPQDLVSGKNEFRFVAEQGTYLLDRLNLRTTLSSPVFPLYFFNLNSSVYKKVANNTINSTLALRFVGDNERKVATIDINNQKTHLDTLQATYSKNVDSFLMEGSNFIRVVPDSTLSIIGLKLTLDCKTAADCS